MLPEMEFKLIQNQHQENLRTMLKEILESRPMTYKDLYTNIGISGKTFYSFMKGALASRVVTIKIETWINANNENQEQQ